MSDLFQTGQFQLHRIKSDFKIECDALSDMEVAVLAWQLRQRLPLFGSVEGVPTGGFRLAKAMEAFITKEHPEMGLRHLISPASIAVLNSCLPTN
jgi:hypothetical protein